MNNPEKCLEEYPEVRKVIRKDLPQLSGLLIAFANKSGNTKLRDLAPTMAKNAMAKKEEEVVDPKKEEEQLYNVIKSVLTSALQWMEEDLVKWFMTLINIQNKEDYDKLPIDIDMYIIEELVNQQGFKDFFLRALNLYKKIQGGLNG